MALATGIYRVNTLLHDAVDQSTGWDVENGSLADFANIWLIHDNDTPAQIFEVSTVTVSGTVYYQFRNIKSGKVLEATNGIVASGGNVSQFTRWNPDTYPDNAAGQMWIVTDKGTETVGGATYTVYQIANRKNSSIVMDCYNGSYQDMTNLWLFTAWPDSDPQTRAQRWIFHKDSDLDGNLPIPANPGWAYGVGNTIYTGGMWCNASTKLYPACYAGAAGYQIRYRITGRYAGTWSWSGWGDWQTPAGSKVELGWGDPWAAYFTGSRGDGRQYCPDAVDVGALFSTYDRIGVQFEIRRFDASGHTYGAAHGGSALADRAMVWHPTITIGDCFVVNDGITLTLTSDFKRNGNKVHIKSITANGTQVCGAHDESNIAYSGGMVTIPWSELSFMPSDGASLSVVFDWETIDGRFGTYTLTGTLQMSANHGIAISPTLTETDGYGVKITVASGYSYAAWLAYDNGGKFPVFEELDHLTDTSFVAYPPLNKGAWHLLISATGTGGAWGTYYTAESAVACDRIVWNMSSGFAALHVGVGDSPSRQRTLDRDCASVLPNGSDFEVTSFNVGSKRALTAKGALIHGETGADVSDFDALSKADYALFRDVDGFRARVAITSVQMVPHHEYTEIDVAMVEQASNDA